MMKPALAKLACITAMALMPAPSASPRDLFGVATGRSAQAPAPATDLQPPHEDFEQWHYWWEFNKDYYLRLRQSVPALVVDEFDPSPPAVDPLRPSQEQLVERVLPALQQTIDSTEQRDLVGSCMLAMAKIGRNGADFRLHDVFARRLPSRDQEVQETAALALGIAATLQPESIRLLIDVATDTAAGRKACAVDALSMRTRAFAIYGLGLWAWSVPDAAARRAVLLALQPILADPARQDRNLKVAAVLAIGLLHVFVEDAGEPDPLLVDAVNTLLAYYDRDLGADEQLVQAHVPTAVAKLLGRHPGRLATEAKQRFARGLRGEGERQPGEQIARSCALALGVMCRPGDGGDHRSPDDDCSRLLLEQYRHHTDEQTRYFSLLALGQIGGKQNHAALLGEFDKATDYARAWCAIAMGVCAFHQYDAAERVALQPEIDRAFGESLHKALRNTRSPNLQGAIAVALGLCRFKEASDDLRSLLMKSKEEEEQGYFCIGLALMSEDRAKVDINKVITNSLRKPKLLQQAAIALGKLGDKTVADTLQKMLGDDDRNLAKLSAVASALGFIGDSRTIAPLIKMLFDDKLTDLSRAFAAVALGCIGDKEDLPWNSKLSCNTNFRAAVETLTGAGTGVLDIL